MTATYVYLGYGVTDENGKAKLEYDTTGTPITHSYTGTGAGEIDIVASLDSTIDDSSLVSETYSIIDGIFYDGGTTGNTNGGFYYNIFSSSDVTHSTDSTGTTVQNLTSSLKTLRVKFANSTELQFPNQCKIEFDCLGITGNVSLQVWKSNTSGDYRGIDLDNALGGLSQAHMSLELTGSNAIFKVNDTVKLDTSFSFVSSGNMSIRFLLEDNCSFKYKDFVVYPI